MLDIQRIKRFRTLKFSLKATINALKTLPMKLNDSKNNSTNSLMKNNLPLQQQTMLEPFTSRLGNPVTPGPGNAKELRETMHTTEQWQPQKEFIDWDEALKVAEEYRASKQPAQQLSEDCIQEFKEMIAIYLESSELTPWQFIACLKAALEASLKEQKHIKDSLRNTLLLIEGNGDDWRT